ncbi:putative ABC-type transport system ATP-binding protein [Candidatus Kuenenia stuttgartiensis]|uniref:Putative ABC-type transport system ATP-binding protein n=1 Tax=Kuenenia stuttgartiensis TaxID=174633 RepID=Q1Q0W6_KUEST|nr:ABC transporter permease [Candidatus Kuenenia stuttgartiensis]MCF6151961.1 FtsX-like permease family protein [Candidatus Kuenenia stuttgartiensis]QII10673.1 putative ABC-type transport system ATP-binding protein [Candidatus Kuenenia stuttgartiensis]CAJ73637.1 similar to ABC-type transport system ATP-binding protein [Candidatus Kuenenia stuttgartiensis]
MRLLFFYSFRNLLTRRVTTALTASGMALVVFVFAAIIMLAEGLQKTLIETGSYNNIVVLRKSSSTEVQSIIERYQASIIETQPEVALDENGRRVFAKELVVLITLQKKGSSSSANVVIRGIGNASVDMRPQVKLSAGRLPLMGTSEIMTGNSVAKRFKNAGLGDSIFFAMRSWKVVGIFDAGDTGFSSEIWGDADQFMQAFRRNAYSSLIFRAEDDASLQKLQRRIENDPRLTFDAMIEVDYYKKQSEMMAKFLRILGISLTAIFSIGAVIGAMVTMYSAVANRTSEIGTLRALGFGRVNILMAFLLESIILGFLGGCAGLFFASVLQFISVSTTNFQTFSELAFRFRLSPGIILKAMAFALLMGFFGGILPAFRASRMNIVESLREV